MNVGDYLCAKYGVSRPTTMLYIEAKAFGIPYPLRNGWIGRYCGMPITSDMAERLTLALEKKDADTEGGSESAKSGLRVLRDAHLTLKRTPGANDAEFLASKAWKRLRYQALLLHGNRCQCCGASTAQGAVLNVDHIKPRRLFPQLALQLDNLQVLCGDCNEGKGNWDMTDVRETAVPP